MVGVLAIVVVDVGGVDVTVLNADELAVLAGAMRACRLAGNTGPSGRPGGS